MYPDRFTSSHKSTVKHCEAKHIKNDKCVKDMKTRDEDNGLGKHFKELPELPGLRFLFLFFLIVLTRRRKKTSKSQLEQTGWIGKVRECLFLCVARFLCPAPSGLCTYAKSCLREPEGCWIYMNLTLWHHTENSCKHKTHPNYPNSTPNFTQNP